MSWSKKLKQEANRVCEGWEDKDIKAYYKQLKKLNPHPVEWRTLRRPAMEKPLSPEDQAWKDYLAKSNPYRPNFMRLGIRDAILR